MSIQHLDTPLTLADPHSTRWPWPLAALAIILLSLLLWGGIAAVAVLAFSWWAGA